MENSQDETTAIALSENFGAVGANESRQGSARIPPILVTLVGFFLASSGYNRDLIQTAS